MVAMASESYLLQARCRQCDNGKRATSAGEVAMAVTLIVLVAGILSLASIVFFLNMKLNAVQARMLEHEVTVDSLQGKLTRLNVIEQMKMFEMPPKEISDTDTVDDEDDDKRADDDNLLPFYVDEDSNIIETRVRADREETAGVQPLMPAGSLLQQRAAADPASHPVDTEQAASVAPQPQEPNSAPTSPPPTSAPEEPDQAAALAPEVDGADDNLQPDNSPVMAFDGEEDFPPERFPAGGFLMRENPEVRKRRAAPQPQLRLYHMLQQPQAPAPSWSAYGSQQPQPMYAERPPTGFVTLPPRPTAAVPRSTTPASPVVSRRSRVMDVAAIMTPTPPLPSLHRQRHRTGRRQRLRDQQGQQDVSQYGQHSVESIDATLEVEQTLRTYSPVVEGPAIAAHFIGDSARHRGSHHYDDNGRLKHPTGEYMDWRPSDWVRDLSLDRHFRLSEAGGHVTVDTPGLYFVYAQVNYANDKDENGFWVYRNGHKELLCAVTSVVSSASAHANTCFTAGVLHLASGDRVSLRDLAGDRYRVLDHPGRSFVGLVNLSSCKLKQELPNRVAS